MQLYEFGVFALVVACFMLAIKAVIFFKQDRWATGFFITMLMLFLGRIAVLKLGTTGGTRGVGDARNSFIVKFLGDDITFLTICTLVAITCFFYLWANDVKPWIRPFIEQQVAVKAGLAGEGVHYSGNDDHHQPTDNKDNDKDNEVTKD